MTLLLTTENLLAPVGNTLEPPTEVVATTTKIPFAFVLVVRLSVAEVPLGLIVVFAATIAGGENAGTKENVEPDRFVPVTVTVVVVFGNAPCGAIDVMTGRGRTVKLVVEV